MEVLHVNDWLEKQKIHFTILEQREGYWKHFSQIEPPPGFTILDEFKAYQIRKSYQP